MTREEMIKTIVEATPLTLFQIAELWSEEDVDKIKEKMKEMEEDSCKKAAEDVSNILKDKGTIVNFYEKDGALYIEYSAFPANYIIGIDPISSNNDSVGAVLGVLYKSKKKKNEKATKHNI